MAEQLKARVVDDILETLADGKYHTFEQISFGCRHLNNNQVEAILSFLDGYGFIIRRRQPGTLTKTRVAKLDPAFRTFLQRVQELENTKAKEATR